MRCTPPLSLARHAAQRSLAIVLSVFAAAALAETASCSSDGKRAPRLLLERFLSADCATCWSAADTPRAPRGALVLDWVVPGAEGEQAPLSAVARRESQDRIENLRLRLPDKREQLSKSEQIGNQRVRVSHGVVFNGYVGASLAFHGKRSAHETLTGWLALVEMLPAGTEGSPVPRVLVRNVLVEPIAARPHSVLGQMWRPMNLPAGTRAERIALIGWVSDARGRILGAAQAHCPDEP